MQTGEAIGAESQVVADRVGSVQEIPLALQVAAQAYVIGELLVRPKAPGDEVMRELRAGEPRQ
jgi:hypothetical protein